MAVNKNASFFYLVKQIALLLELFAASAYAHAAEPVMTFRPVTFDWIKEEIVKQGVASIDHFISILPDRYRSNFVSMKNSKSSQGASPSRPRIIMFGNGDSTLIAFNGDPQHRGFNKVELIEFKANDRKFEFREIDFSNGQVKFSPANPARCLACHHKNLPRPIWPDYPHWDGAYGEDDDIPQSNEIEDLKKFVAEAPRLDRYRHLMFEPKAELGPFVFVDKGQSRFRPNMRMTKLLSRLHAKSLLHRMESSPRFALHRDLILLRSIGSHYKSGDLLAGFPLDHYNKPSDLSNPLRDIHDEANRFFLALAKEVGIGPKDWTLAFTPAHQTLDEWHFYNEGKVGMAGLVMGELWRSLIADSPEMAQFYSPIKNGDPNYEWIDQLGKPAYANVPYGSRPNILTEKALMTHVEENLRKARGEQPSTVHPACKVLTSPFVR